jgi:hypothetical protein
MDDDSCGGSNNGDSVDDNNNGCGCNGNDDNDSNGCGNSNSGRHRQQSTLAADKTAVVEATAAMTTMRMMVAAVAATMVTATMKGQPNRNSISIGYEDGNYKLG